MPHTPPPTEKQPPPPSPPSLQNLTAASVFPSVSRFLTAIPPIIFDRSSPSLPFPPLTFILPPSSRHSFSFSPFTSIAFFSLFLFSLFSLPRSLFLSLLLSLSPTDSGLRF
ncbi:hypothetical protein ACMYSQ_002688 [Aspergillus niger]